MKGKLIGVLAITVSLFYFTCMDITAGEPDKPMKEGIGVEKMEKKDEGWSPQVAGPLVAEPADTMEPKMFSLQVLESFAIIRGSFNNDGKKVYRRSGDRKYTFTSSLIGNYGIKEGWDIKFTFPIIYKHATEMSDSASSTGMGDIAFSSKYRLIEDKENTPIPTLSIFFMEKFPIGKFEKLSARKLGTDERGNGSYETTIGLTTTKKIKPVIVHANLFFDLVSNVTKDGVGMNPSNMLIYNLAGEFVIDKTFTALLEFNGNYQGRRKEGGMWADNTENYSLSILPGIEVNASEKLIVTVGPSITLSGRNSDFGITPMVSFLYSF